MSMSDVPTVLGAATMGDYGQFGRAMLEEYEKIPARQLYYYLLNVDEYSGVRPKAFDIVEKQLCQAEEFEAHLPTPLKLREHSDSGLEQYLERMRAWGIRRSDDFSEPLSKLTKEQCGYLLRQYAPTALLDGCWLQNGSCAATSHTEETTRMLKLYVNEIGDGDPAQHHGNAYRDLLHSLGIYLPDVASWAFVEQQDVLDSSFEYPIFLLSLSQFPRSFRPELLGLNLFYYICGICPIYLALRNGLQARGASIRFMDLHALDSHIHGPAETAVDLVKINMEAAAKRDPESVGENWGRIWRGMVSAYTAQHNWLDQLTRFTHSPERAPQEKMIELIRRKARHAFGYHATQMLEDRSIDDWLNPDTLDPEKFLSAFARSHYITPGDAQGSLFMSQLVAFRGPMFRIFSPEELQTISDWIDTLPQDGDETPAGPLDASDAHVRVDHRRANHEPAPLVHAVKDVQKESIQRYAKKPLGEVFYFVLNVEHFPDVRPFARDFASRWLQRAGKGLRRGRRPLPFEPYQHQALDSWIEAQHTRQVESYHKIDGARQSREQLIQSTVQLAPMILIDGAWIQNASNAGTSHTRVGSKLFHIYFDEVGNGEVELNHPNVFRELLKQMEVELPEFGTQEFGRWPGFDAEAFQVPVFWLCISQFPKRFLPETLGLNLAMELSGVGGTYREAIDTLRHHGFDPCFVELHNTIDNVSSGHTAWARDAIKCHMDEVFSHGGEAQVQETWERVWTGYRALAPPTGLLSWLGIRK